MSTSIVAAVVRTLKAPFTIEKLQLDDIRPNEVRVRMVEPAFATPTLSYETGFIPPNSQQYWATKERA